MLHVEGMPPRVMRAGASALFDSSAPHAYLAGSKGGAKILIVVLRAYGPLGPSPAAAAHMA